MKNILIEQNRHWSGKRYGGVRRHKLDKLISYLPLRQIIAVTGIRRCGKSTLVKQAIDHLVDSGVDAKNILFVNLEHPAFVEKRESPMLLEEIYETYLKLMNPTGKVYCVFDEIQYVKEWQVAIKNRYELGEIKFIITGSNSSMLSNELTTLLSGRSLTIELDTFSFAEYLDYQAIPYATELERLTHRIPIARAKESYLKWGGFYEVFTIEDDLVRQELLTAYARNIIYQDIVPRYKIRHAETVERLFFYLLGMVGGILNYATLSKIFDISDKTVREYMRYFEDVFFFHRIDRFHTKPKERIRSTKKLYLGDNGFLQIAPKHSENLGIALENGVFNLLRNRCKEVTYLKENVEIDFKCEKTLYQVAWRIDDPATRKRETEAFKKLDPEGKYSHRIVTYEDHKEIEGIDILDYETFALAEKI
ncbi:ATP-binding protein [Nitratifractor sp.]|uniref:ATP-binding protein n=1 Tax=Nitratifractor sp. TaxID=2268144 RepID=UPI0025E5BB84|nr:ATP-binding protein [Nitratifractor sp.]